MLTNTNVKINQVAIFAQHRYCVQSSGNFPLPGELSSPWILPPIPEQTESVKAMKYLPDGHFCLKAEKANHEPYFKFQPGDEWLITRKPCILLQRTTAKEQDKRLIAAPIPLQLVKKGVVIENHLNIIIAVT